MHQILSQVKAALSSSAQPIADWIATRGVSFATDVVAALVILVIGAVIIKIFAAVLKRTILKRFGSRTMLASLIVSVLVKVAWAFLAVIVLDKLGVEVGPLIAGLGVTGFILGFAFQESLGSLAAGMMIAINEPFKVGDFVSVAGFEGVIRHLDMMAVTLSTGDNRLITIPNKQAWGSPIVNYSAQAERRVDLAVSIAYGADIAKAREVAVKALSAVPGVLKSTAPTAEISSLGESAMVLSCRVWSKNADYWSVYFAGLRQLKLALDENGIEIPFPQLDVHVTNK